MDQTTSQTTPNPEYDGDLRSDSSKRLLEVYDQIAAADDVALMTAALLTTSNYYTFALRVSNEINDRQGKNRLTVDERTAQLTRYSLETDLDEITDNRMYQLFIDTINQYLVDKQELPSNDRAAKMILSRVKALFISLVATGQAGIIPSLTIPNYMLEKVSNLFIKLRDLKNEALEVFIQYLEQSGNQEMIEIIKPIGSEFWGSEGIKANAQYDRYFGQMQSRIRKPVETYDMYLKCRSKYRKATKNIIPSTIYEIFDMTPDAYNNARKNVYNELQVLFSDQKDTDKITRRLIFGTED